MDGQRVNPILLVGKGPTARPVAAVPGFEIAALNAAIRLCKRADYLFVNDTSALQDLNSDDLARAATLVLPARLHGDTRGGRLLDWRDCVDGLPDGVRVELFELHTNPRRDPRLPYFGRMLSVGESAAAWLLAHGYRQFFTLGIDASGGYSPYFEGGPHVAKPASWFGENCRRIHHRIETAGGTMEAMNTLTCLSDFNHG
ncbi:MAG: hypothetical protein KY476_16975 [Planctomycetes bacterium]|nr:hypothetical protein [Planctomycetota bacterium]